MAASHLSYVVFCSVSYLAAAATKHSSVLSDVTNAINSSAKTQLAKQPVQLPAEKQVEVPPAQLVGQLCCPPELVLVDHFREQRRHILEVSLSVCAEVKFQQNNLHIIRRF